VVKNPAAPSIYSREDGSVKVTEVTGDESNIFKLLEKGEAPRTFPPGKHYLKFLPNIEGNVVLRSGLDFRACTCNDWGTVEGLYPVTRKWERRRVAIPVTLLLDGGAEACPAMTVDLSPQGMRLQAEATLLQGQPVRIHLTAAPDRFLNARVAWVGKPSSASAGHLGFEILNSHPMFVH
jgi:hypothetical protein